jgi:hypothetical protein
MDAAGSLSHGSLRREFDHDTIEIAGAFLRITEVKIKEWFVDAFLTVDVKEITGYSLHAILQGVSLKSIIKEGGCGVTPRPILLKKYAQKIL